jgi:hypothetical protein
MKRTILFLVFVCCFSVACQNSKKKCENKQEDKQADLSKVCLVDTLIGGKLINIFLESDSIFEVVISISNFESTQSFVKEGYNENISIDQKRIFLKNKADTKCNFYALNDTTFIFSILDFKYRVTVFGFTINSKKEICLFKNISDKYEIIQGEMQYILLDPERKIIMAHSDMYISSEDEKEFRYVYLYKVEPTGFSLMNTFKITINSVGEELFLLGNENDYFDFYSKLYTDSVIS